MNRFKFCSAVLAANITFPLFGAEVLGNFSSCNHSKFIQRSEAQSDMTRNANEACGADKFAVQTTTTFFEDAHACIRYQKGQLATANFECLRRDLKMGPAEVVVGTVANYGCTMDGQTSEFDEGMPDQYRDAGRMLFVAAKARCGSAMPVLFPESAAYSCGDSLLTVTAIYRCAL